MTNINLRNFNLAQDWWKASILMALLIGVLFAGGYAASQGAQVSLSFDIQAQIKEIEERLDAPVNSSLAGMQKPYTEIISMVDSYYVRQNGTDGRLILPYSTNKTYVQQQSLGNVTTGSVYLKEMTLASGLTYGTTVLVIQQYQGQLSYYSNSALIYTVKSGSLNATVIYAGVLNASTNYVQAYRLLVENGTSFPSTASSGYVFFRTDWNLLTFYNGTGWTNCTTGSVDDLTVYLLKDGSRALTGNWNVGGSYGVYGATWLNATQMNAYTFYLNGQPLGWIQPYSFLIDYNASSGLYRSWHGANSTLASQGTNASVVINNVNGNMTSNGIVYMRSGIYQIANVSLNNAAHWIGEDGCVWNLTYKPCLTITAATVFEGINFSSVVDGYNHILLAADTEFLSCRFNFRFDSLSEDGSIQSTASTVKFSDCTIDYGGKDTADYFYFFNTASSMTRLEIDKFTIVDVCVNGSGAGETRLFTQDSGVKITTLDCRNIYWQHLCAKYNGNKFIHDLNTSMAVIDGFTFPSGQQWLAAQAHLAAFTIYADSLIVDHVQIEDRCHNYAGISKSSLISNYYYKGDAVYGGGIDNGAYAGSIAPRKVSFINCYLENGSLDFNNGLSDIEVTGTTIVGGRIAFLNETVPSGTNYNGDMRATITNTHWVGSATGKWDLAILLSYDQGLNLSSLQVSGCAVEDYNYFLQPTADSQYPSHILVDGLQMGHRVDSGHPRFIGDATRTTSNITISVLNSNLMLQDPPLGSWSIITGDELQNDVFINTLTSTTTYSEYGGSLTNNTATTFSITHNLVGIPVFVACSFNSTQIDGWAWTATSTTITVTVHNRVTTDAIVTCYWEAK